MVQTRIPIDNHPDLVALIADTYNGGRVFDTYVHKITLDGNDVNMEIDLNINDTWGIHGTVQMGLDDDNTVAAKLREIISLEEGNDMNADRDHLGRHCFQCGRDIDKECTNLVHAKLYAFITHRGAAADKEGYDSMPEQDVAKMITEMGFEACEDPCESEQRRLAYHGLTKCFHRRKQTEREETNNRE